MREIAYSSGHALRAGSDATLLSAIGGLDKGDGQGLVKRLRCFWEFEKMARTCTLVAENDIREITLLPAGIPIVEGDLVDFARVHNFLGRFMHELKHERIHLGSHRNTPLVRFAIFFLDMLKGV